MRAQCASAFKVGRRSYPPSSTRDFTSMMRPCPSPTTSGSFPSHRISQRYWAYSGVIWEVITSMALAVASASIMAASASPLARAIVAFLSASAWMICCWASYRICSSLFFASRAACSAVTLASMAAEKAALNWKSSFSYR